MSVGQKIIDGIISGSLIHGICAHDKDHGVVMVWSSNADEQLEALAANDEILRLKEKLANAIFERDALLEMTWLDLPGEPCESTKRWREEFEKGWTRK